MAPEDENTSLAGRPHIGPVQQLAVGANQTLEKGRAARQMAVFAGAVFLGATNLTSTKMPGGVIRVPAISVWRCSQMRITAQGNPRGKLKHIEKPLACFIGTRTRPAFTTIWYRSLLAAIDPSPPMTILRRGPASTAARLFLRQRRTEAKYWEASRQALRQDSGKLTNGSLRRSCRKVNFFTRQEDYHQGLLQARIQCVTIT